MVRARRSGSAVTTIMVLLAAAIALSAPAPASAQATRTWISGVGDDANPCSRTAPCKTFQGAISKTAATGEINTLDPGGYGAVTITKSITLRSEGQGTAGILVAGTSGITINAATTDRVSLVGLDIDGLTTQGSPAGVRILQAGRVSIRHSDIYGFGAGVAMLPGNAGAALAIVDTHLDNNATGSGLNVQPTGPGTATVSVRGSTLSGNRDGLVARGASTVNVYDSDISQNANAGVFAGPTAEVRIARNTISQNAFGLSVSPSGGKIVSFGGNVIFGNTTNGAPNQTVATVR